MSSILTPPTTRWSPVEYPGDPLIRFDQATTPVSRININQSSARTPAHIQAQAHLRGVCAWLGAALAPNSPGGWAPPRSAIACQADPQPSPGDPPGLRCSVACPRRAGRHDSVMALNGDTLGRSSSVYDIRIRRMADRRRDVTWTDVSDVAAHRPPWSLRHLIAFDRRRYCLTRSRPGCCGGLSDCR